MRRGGSRISQGEGEGILSILTTPKPHPFSLIDKGDLKIKGGSYKKILDPPINCSGLLLLYRHIITYIAS